MIEPAEVDQDFEAELSERMSSPELSIRIPALLRFFRKQRKVSQISMARAMHTTPQTVQRLETSGMTMSIEWLDKMCQALGIDPAMLFMYGTTTRDVQKELVVMARQSVIDDLTKVMEKLKKDWDK